VSVVVDANVLCLALGGNLGCHDDLIDRMGQVVAAWRQLGTVTPSSLYRTEAVGGPPQPQYLNAVVAVTLFDGALHPRELIDRVLTLERRLGRTRADGGDNQPRVIDLDVLLWGERQLTWAGPPSLVVPHPRLAMRHFVVAPLIELLSAAFTPPGFTCSLGQLLADVAHQPLARSSRQWR
jgi:2-amino-4-hydroxy-6-hydroxymethyldihydropteridine diphosphokinase